MNPAPAAARTKTKDEDSAVCGGGTMSVRGLFPAEASTGATKRLQEKSMLAKSSRPKTNDSTAIVTVVHDDDVDGDRPERPFRSSKEEILIITPVATIVRCLSPRSIVSTNRMHSE
mmetsp:Transcript_8895/g.14681  ORF Transcript_8895/g.14681 Transcript_8895/m.14681 type:complete len:116 (-) Transcript_8895:65-412(-)